MFTANFISTLTKARLRIALLNSVLIGSIAQAQFLPDVPVGDVTIRLKPIATGLRVEQEFLTPVFTQRVGPTDIGVIPGSAGDMLVTTYGGLAFRMDRFGQRGAQPFLDLTNPAGLSFSENFEFGGAHGLTSIAFHPEFSNASSPGYLKFYTLEAEHVSAGAADFVESTRAGNHHQEALYEYQLQNVDQAVCDATCFQNRREVLRVHQPTWHHNFGDLLFDSNGLLYVSSGDGGVSGKNPPFISDNSQTLETVFGKVLRIDPLGNNSPNGQYGIPSDNPFVDGAGPNVDEIFAYGLRNPYRLEMDSRSGQIYATETGELQIESLNAITRGGNFGWDELEGSFIYDPSTKNIVPDVDANGNGIGDLAESRGYSIPVFEYGRQDGRAITGASAYEGTDTPHLNGKLVLSDFTGKLFYGDPTTGELFKLGIDPAGASPPLSIHGVTKNAAGEILIYGIVKTSADTYGGVIYQVQGQTAVDGDFDQNGVVDARDIDAMTSAILAEGHAPLYDLNDDARVDQADRRMLISEVLRTYAGDANLDGQFNSTDLVNVFVADQYEDGVENNSGWANGDWDGDFDFSSSDLVAAFVEDGYEKGPRPAANVPEPSSLIATLFVFTAILVVHRTTSTL